MKIFDTTQIPHDGSGLTDNEIYWLYNGFDCCLTSEIRDKLSALMDDTARATYEHEMRMQGPLIEMMLRGTLIDEQHRKKVVKETEAKLAGLEASWARICLEGLGLPEVINWKSPAQTQTLFYEILNIPEIKKKKASGKVSASTDRETLEKLSQYFTAELFANFILAMRDFGKQLGFLKTPLDDDNRIRCNFNEAGTNTGRLSSSFSDFGTGTNLQNIDRNLRYIFVADPGKVFVNIDLEQADSRNVGAICWESFVDLPREEITKLLRAAKYLKPDQDWKGPIGPEFAGSYLDACESGDLHTEVCRMSWTELLWPEDLDARRAVAEEIAYRTYSYRDMAKKLGHGTNYYGQPKTMAGHTKVPVAQISTFQHRYFDAFTCIPAFHAATIHELQTTGQLTTLFGRRRYFFNRLDDQSTINAAIAYRPQSMTGEEINLGILNLWRDPRFELLIQVHDSILFQIDQTQIEELVPLALELMKVELTLKRGRKFSVPLDAEVGWNWGKAGKDGSNPFGLRKWTGSETRTPPKRRASARRVSIMDYL